MDEEHQAQLIRALFRRPEQPDAAVTACSREAALAAVGGSSRLRAARRRVPGRLITAAAAQVRLTHGFSLPQPRLGRTRSWVLAGVSAAAAVGGTAALIAAAIWQLAAAPAAAAAPWTVTTKPREQISVTIRELRDPAGLQRRLRADGVRASVRFHIEISKDHGRIFVGPLVHNPRCNYPLRALQGLRLMARIFPHSNEASGQIVFVINPSAIPAGTELWIGATRPVRGGPQWLADASLIYPSGRCPSGKPTRFAFYTPLPR